MLWIVFESSARSPGLLLAGWWPKSPSSSEIGSDGYRECSRL